MKTGWRKRLEHASLRWSGWIDAGGGENVVPWLMAAVLFGVLVSLSLARSHALNGGEQLATVTQSLWLIAEGFRPVSSLLDGNYMAEQAAWVVYPLGFVTEVLPRVTTLLVVQAAALAITVVPLWKLARQRADLKIGPSTTLVFAYGIAAAVHNMNLADFHPEVLAVPALVAAVLFGLERKWFRYVLCLLFVIACRADLALAIAGLGLLLVLERRKRAGWLTFVAAVGYFVLALYVIQPGFADGAYPHIDEFAKYGSSPHGVLWGLITSPVELAGDLFSRENFRRTVGFLAPVLFLPVVAPRYLFPAVPLFMLYMVANVPEDPLLEASQSVPMTVFVFVATAFALQRAGTVLVERVVIDRRVIWALVFTASVFFFLDSASSPYQDPKDWDADEADERRLAVAERIPDTAAVRAGPKLLPLLAERERLFLLDTGLDDAGQPDHEAAIDRVEWIVLDGADAFGWENETIVFFNLSLGREGWDFQSQADGVLVWRRGTAVVDAGGGSGDGQADDPS